MEGSGGGPAEGWTAMGEEMVSIQVDGKELSTHSNGTFANASVESRRDS